MKERLFELRKSVLKLSREKFGAKVGMSGSEVRNVEEGLTQLKENKIPLICAAYNVSEHWLREGTGDMFKLSSETDELTKLINEILSADDTDDVKKLAIAFAKLSDENRRKAAQIAKELANNIK